MATVLESVETQSNSIAVDALYEVIDGEMVELPSMGTRQELFAGRLHVKLASQVESNQLGQAVMETLFDFREQVDRKRRPDLAFVSSQTWPVDQDLPDVDGWPVIPDLAIEIISKSNSWEDTLEKIDEYFEVGVKRVWVFSLKSRKIHIFRSPTEVEIITPKTKLQDAELLPGVSLDLESLFPKPDSVPSNN